MFLLLTFSYSNDFYYLREYCFKTEGEYLFCSDPITGEDIFLVGVGHIKIQECTLALEESTHSLLTLFFMKKNVAFSQLFTTQY